MRFADSSLAKWLMPLLGCCWIGTAVSAKDEHTVEVLYPQVGQLGTTVEVTVEGAFLQQPQEVLFYQPGIRCLGMEPIGQKLETRNGLKQPAEPGTAIRLTLQIAPDAPLGEHQLRIRTRDNLSEMVTFWVTPFVVVAEQHAWTDAGDVRNDEPKFAQHVPLSCTVYGYLPGSQPQDHDWYSVDCSQGQTLSVEAVATRLGTLHYGGLNDPAIRVYDADGNEVARNDDNAFASQDPVVSFVVPKTGKYFIDMHQQMDYEAGRLRHYLLHVGTFDRPAVVYPQGGQTGTTQKFAMLGGATEIMVTELSLPASVGPYEQAYVSVTPQSMPPPTANRIHVADFPNVYERSGPSSPEKPQLVSEPLPIAINGRITERGQVDWYKITAKKGQRYRVRSFSSTLDSELDARIWIRPAAGNTSNREYDEDDSRWEPHDLIAHHYRHQTKERLDPIFMFEPDTDGEWLLGVGDTRREGGPRHIYRIEFQPHIDSAFVHFDAYPSKPKIVRDRVVLYPGHSYSRPVTIMNGFGSTYNKPLQLRAVGLPDGVTMEASRFTQNDGVIPVLFRAHQDSQPAAVTADLIVEPVDEADRASFRGGFIQVNQSTNRRGDYAMYFNRTRKLAVAVCQGATFDVEIEPPKVPLVRNGELTLQVNLKRHDGFSGAVYCQMDWLPPGVNNQPPLIISADESSGIYKLSASSNAPTGEFNVSITGRENEGGHVRSGAGFHYVCSPFVRLSVGDPYVTVKLARAAVERRKIGTIQAQIQQHKPFDGPATLTLGRLPFGVRQVKPFPIIKSRDTSATFHVEVTADCLVGQYQQLYCEVAIEDGGQTIRQQTGDGILRVDPERE